MITAKYFKYDEEYNLRPVYNDDVVEVVRCEDCVHHYKGNCYRIEKVTLSVNADDFCSRGDRKETE